MFRLEKRITWLGGVSRMGGSLDLPWDTVMEYKCDVFHSKTKTNFEPDGDLELRRNQRD